VDIFKDHKSGRWLSPGKIALIVLCTPVYVIIFGEFFLRLFAGVALMPRYVTGGDDGIRRNIPNSVYGQTSREVDVEIRVNSQGMRADKDYSLEKPNGQCRIAVLGDSFFMGYEVALEHSFSYLLQNNLATAGLDCEVLNFSVSGFGTAEYIVAMESRVLPFDPDLVIFELHLTDLRENVISNLFKIDNGKLVRTGNNYLPAIEVRDKLMQYAVYRWMIEHSQLYSVVREQAGAAVKALLLVKNTVKQFFTSQPAETPAADEPGNSPADLFYELLKRGKQLSNENGARFMLVDIPNGFDPPNYYSVLDIEMEPYDLPSHFNVVSPMPVFMDPANKRTKYFYRTAHLHLSIEGNRVVADLASASIVEKSLLSGSSLDALPTTSEQTKAAVTEE